MHIWSVNKQNTSKHWYLILTKMSHLTQWWLLGFKRVTTIEHSKLVEEINQSNKKPIISYNQSIRIDEKILWSSMHWQLSVDVCVPSKQTREIDILFELRWPEHRHIARRQIHYRWFNEVQCENNRARFSSSSSLLTDSDGNAMFVSQSVIISDSKPLIKE